MTNEPTAEIPAPPAPGRRAPALGRPAGAVATGPDVRTPGRGTAGVAGEAPAVDGTTARTVTDRTPDASTAVPGTTPPTVTDRIPDASAADAGTAPPARPVARRRRWPVVLLSVLLVAALGLGGYLFATTRAYAERLDWTEQQARAIGSDLTLTRTDLEGARSEITALQAQLTTAQDRITALADEKAQIGDDREAQRQLLDYQARVSEAAGIVASALDRCVQGQDQLIAYLEDADSYDPADLSKFGSDVEALCQSASDANDALQSELAEK